jgi:rhodanese-related sulfurtransferase
MLFSHGYTGMLVLLGGTRAWEQAGYPLVKGDRP